jgi:HlyD family secretion protein
MTGRRNIVPAGAIGVVLVTATSGWVHWGGRMPSNQLTLSGVLEADEIHVGSLVGGRVGQVLVRDGERVAQGQSLIRFDVYDLDARRADAAAKVSEAESALQKLLSGARPEEIAGARAQANAAEQSLALARNGPRQQEVDGARADVEAATADYEFSRATLARIDELSRGGVLSRQEHDTAKADYDRASARLSSARQRLELQLAGSRSEEIARADQMFQQAVARRQMVERGARAEDIAAARAGLERARAALESIDVQWAELVVKSPADAFVEVLQVRPGDVIKAGAPVATLIEADRLWVRAYAPGPDLGYLQLGKAAIVSVDTFPDSRFPARITQIASRGSFTPRNVQTREERSHQVFALRARIDDNWRMLRPGMTAELTIDKSVGVGTR